MEWTGSRIFLGPKWEDTLSPLLWSSEKSGWRKHTWSPQDQVNYVLLKPGFVLLIVMSITVKKSLNYFYPAFNSKEILKDWMFLLCKHLDVISDISTLWYGYRDGAFHLPAAIYILLISHVSVDTQRLFQTTVVFDLLILNPWLILRSTELIYILRFPRDFRTTKRHRRATSYCGEHHTFHLLL